MAFEWVTVDVVGCVVPTAAATAVAMVPASARSAAASKTYDGLGGAPGFASSSGAFEAAIFRSQIKAMGSYKLCFYSRIEGIQFSAIGAIRSVNLL